MKEKTDLKEKVELKEKIMAVFIKDGKIKKDSFLILVLIGMLVLVVLWPVSEENKAEGSLDIFQKNTAETGQNEQTEENYYQNESTEEIYVKQLEEKLQDILELTEGVGKVRVMITLEGSEETLVEKDIPKNQASTTEVDAEGGSRNTSNVENGAETIYIEAEDGSRIPYVKKTISPVVQGVLVAAQGGDNKTVNKNITEAIVSLFGIEAHKIKIVKMSQ